MEQPTSEKKTQKGRHGRPQYRRKPAEHKVGAESDDERGRAAVGTHNTFIAKFERSTSTFTDRAGEPDELSAAIGHVVFHFSELSAQLDVAIAMLLGVDKQLGELVTRMMPYRNKVDALGALVWHHAANGCMFNVGEIPLSEVLVDLLRACDEAGQYRHQVLGEGWNGLVAYLRQDGTYLHVSRSGVTSEDYDADFIKDIADFICAVSMNVEEFLFDFPQGAHEA